jgi:hypothetical protein
MGIMSEDIKSMFDDPGLVVDMSGFHDKISPEQIDE